MLRRIATAVCLLAHACPAHASPVKVSEAHRVKNVDPSGVCWFACAATVGNHAGIRTLRSLPEKVIATGIGHKTGATDESIAHWLREAGVAALSNPRGEKGEEGVRRVQSWLDAGLPVIASYSDGKIGHAVLLTGISRKKEKWKTASGESADDFSVTYIDPDDQKEWTVNWAWFHKVWTGRAFAFDPSKQDKSVMDAPPTPQLRPGRLMQATGTFVPTKALPPHLLSRAKLPPVEVRHEAPPYYPHQLPFDAEYAHNQGPPPKVPSNRDIKDGVERPADTFGGHQGHYDHDYYAEYREFKARGPAPRGRE